MFDSLMLATFLAMFVVVMLLGSVVAAVDSEVKSSPRAGIQTLKNYCYNYGGVNEYRGYYINNTGQEGVTVFWTTRSHDRTVYRGRPTPLSDIYSYYGSPNNLTRLDVGIDNAYPDPDGWVYNSQSTWIYENATGFVGWTYTKNSGDTTPKALDRTRMVRMPSPNAALSGSNIDLTWSAPSMTIVSEQDANTDIADINAQLKGYLVYRSTTNATWNDNASAGSVVGDLNDWHLVSGVAPISETNWTDTSVELGKTYYYSLKLAFNSSCPVETMWGSQGSNPITITDITPPTITHTPITSTYTNHSIQINATVTDNTGLKNISLWYRGVNNSQYNVSMSCVQPDKYSYQIPAQPTPGTLCYSIWATDNYNNTATHPETGNHAVIILSAAGNISGRVIDSVTEQGIQGAFVSVMQKSVLNSTTNSTGYYIIADVPEGTYTVRAEKTGYENNTRTNVQVVPGQTTTNIDIVLTSLDTTGPIILSTAPENNAVITTPTPRIYANYTDESGINGNSIILVIDGINVTANATITEANISYIPPGAFSDGMHNVSIEVRDAKGNLRSAIWIFIISTKGAISGIVKDANNNPVEGVTITILGTGYSTTTNSDGCYTIANVSAGAYDIKAEMAGYIAQINTGIAVVANQQVQINFILSDAPGTITGIVRDKEGHLLGGVKITAGGVVTTTNSDGCYTITNLSAGIYNVKAEKAGYESETKSTSISGGDFKALDFSLEKMQGESKRALIPSMSPLETVVVILGMIFIMRLRKRRK